VCAIVLKPYAVEPAPAVPKGTMRSLLVRPGRTYGQEREHLRQHSRRTAASRDHCIVGPAPLVVVQPPARRSRTTSSKHQDSRRSGCAFLLTVVDLQPDARTSSGQPRSHPERVIPEVRELSCAPEVSARGAVIVWVIGGIQGNPMCKRLGPTLNRCNRRNLHTACVPHRPRQSFPAIADFPSTEAR
jgi:hypothetical protein